MTTTTWIGAIDADWGNVLNWSGGLPDSTVDAVVNGANPITFAGGTTKSVTFATYTGTMTLPSPTQLSVNGNTTLAAGMTLTPYALTLYFDASGSLTPAGQHLGVVDTNGLSGVVIDLLGDLSAVGMDIYQDATNALHMHGRTITLGGDTSYLYIADGAGLTYSAGATFVFVPLAGGSAFSVVSSAALPAVQVTGADATAVVSIDSAVTCDSYTQTGGTLTNTGSFKLTTVGNFAVDGDAITSLVAQVGGTATAANATITGCNFSGGTELDATDHCVDGGGNTNVDFGSSPSVGATSGFFTLVD